jgi:hypothetical protein
MKHLPDTQSCYFKFLFWQETAEAIITNHWFNLKYDKNTVRTINRPSAFLLLISATSSRDQCPKTICLLGNETFTGPTKMQFQIFFLVANSCIHNSKPLIQLKVRPKIQEH